MKLTICGSARFEKDWHFVNEKLTLAGHTVYSLAVFPSNKTVIDSATLQVQEGAHEWYSDHEKEMLDLIHLNKIANSDAIFVLDVDSYIGASTKREINWATILCKDVFFYSVNPLTETLSLITTNPGIRTKVNVYPIRDKVKPGV